MTPKQIQGFILASGSNMHEIAKELDVSYELVKAVTHSINTRGAATRRVRQRICELAGRSEAELWPAEAPTEQAA